MRWRPASTSWVDCCGARGCVPGDGRGHEGRRRGQRLCVADRALQTQGEDQRERLGTILHVLAQCVADCNTLLAPMLPHSSNAVHRVLGRTGDFMPMPQVVDVADLDDGRAYPVITGDYSATPRWGRVPVVQARRS